MNGDNPQLPPDQNQAGGQWQFRPETGAAPMQPPAPVMQQAPVQPMPQPVNNVPAPPSEVPQQYVAPVAQQPPSLPQPTAPAGVEVAWTASEYVAHSKGAGWYILLFGAALAVAAVAYILTRDMISTVIIVIIAVLVGVSGARKPRVLPYHVGPQGLTIGTKFYEYGKFKSFSIMDEGAFSSIMFLPMQRFMPPLSIYYDPQDEERIIDALSSYLPMEVRKHDVMDNLARRLRF